MQFKLNPITGEFDIVDGNSPKQHMNPVTGEFNLVDGDGPYGYIFNPLSGKLNLIVKATTEQIVGIMELDITNAKLNGLKELIAYGGFAQESGATTITPKDIKCNNGTVAIRHISGLPAEYQRVEYLETDGNAFIDTGILLHNTDLFSVTFQSAAATLTSPVMGAISGGSSYTSTQNFCVTYNQMSNIDAYCIYCDGAAGQPNAAFNAGDYTDMLKHTMVYNGIGTNPTLDGVDMAQLVTTTITPFEATVTTGLFGRKTTATNPTKAQAGVRIFDVDFFEKGHFIPCKRITDNALGFYDVVNNTFVTSSTGTLTAGPAVEDGWTYDVIGTTEKIGLSYLSLDGQGTFVSPSPSSTNRGYKIFEEGLEHINLSISSGWEFIVQGKTGGSGGNISGWVTSFDGDLSGYTTYGIAVRKLNDVAFNYQNFDGVIIINDNFVYATNLFKLGDIEDEHNILSGEVTRKLGIVVLTGDEAWSYATGTNFRQVHCDVIINIAKTNSSLVSNVAPYGCTAGTRGNYNFGCYTGTTSGRLCFQIKGDTTINSANDWVAYLKNKYEDGLPVYVIYPLANPTTELVGAQEINIGAGSNKIEVIEAELDDLKLSAKYLSNN